MSNKPLTAVEDIQQIHDLKPRGLWYGIGNAWLEWVEAEMPEWKGMYFYELDVDESKLLTINETEDIFALEDKYGKILFSDTKSIKWEEVAKDYSGIEIPEYWWGRDRDKHLWFYAWDVSSGCIWDSSAVKSFIQIDESKLSESLLMHSFIKEFLSESYDPPMKNLPQHLAFCPIHTWRADSGIELVHREPSLNELDRIWKNWQKMPEDMKRGSDEKSNELFGMSNEEHYLMLKSQY